MASYFCIPTNQDRPSPAKQRQLYALHLVERKITEPRGHQHISSKARVMARLHMFFHVALGKNTASKKARASVYERRSHRHGPRKAMAPVEPEEKGVICTGPSPPQFSSIFAH
jgi:hypothetical protein